MSGRITELGRDGDVPEILECHSGGNFELRFELTELESARDR